MIFILWRFLYPSDNTIPLIHVSLDIRAHRRWAFEAHFRKENIQFAMINPGALILRRTNPSRDSNLVSALDLTMQLLSLPKVDKNPAVTRFVVGVYNAVTETATGQNT